MDGFIAKVKNTLVTLIESLDSYAYMWSVNPGKDFTRNRKLPFSTMIRVIPLLALAYLSDIADSGGLFAVQEISRNTVLILFSDQIGRSARSEEGSLRVRIDPNWDE